MIQLDRPVWHALGGRQSEFAVEEGSAKRFRRDISPFIACENDDADSLDSVAALLGENDEALFLQRSSVPIPVGCRSVLNGRGVQMVADRFDQTTPVKAIVPLGEADAPAMLELARLTRPGPFLPRTWVLAQFWGIKSDSGRLIAMAGERLRIEGMSELSAVCVHPEFRKRGFGESISRHVCSEITRRGELPFLHAYAENGRAIGLYERLGFRRRCFVEVVLIARAAESHRLPTNSYSCRHH